MSGWFLVGALRKTGLRAAAALLAGSFLAAVSVKHDAAFAQTAKPGTLSIGRSSESETLDPHKSSRLITSHVMYLIYDTLVTMSPDMKEVLPLLAESWKISDDRKVYTFKLRNDVKFHSGDPLTAEAVKFSYERWLDPATKSPSTNYVRSIKTIEVVDPLTVRITLSAPNENFLSDLAIGWAGILNPKSVNAAGANYGTSSADGTGPFRFVEWRRNQSLTLARNDAYKWGPSFYKNRGPALVSQVVWRMMPEDATRVLELETGGINMIYAVPLAEADRLKKDPKISVVDYAFGFTIPIFFNLNHPITADLRVRKAIAHAINREELAQSVYYGYARPASGPIESSFPEFWKGIADVEYPYDPKKAEALLEEAGWKKGPDGIRVKDGTPLRITQYLGAGYGFQEAFTIIQSRLKQVGIQLDLKILEWASVYGFMRNGDHDLGTRWMIYSTPQDLFQQFYHSASAPVPNSAMYKNPEVDGLIAKLATTAPAAERSAIVEQLLRIVMRDLPVLPLTWQREVLAMSRSVKGFQPIQLHGAGFYKLLDTQVE